jgi:hypothetical protein
VFADAGVAEPFDVVVYAATPAGISAAVAAARAGARVVLLEQTQHVGGLSTSGLVTAESEHMQLASFSGLALEVYRRLGAAYGLDGPIFYWESKVAERVFEDLLAGEDGVELRLGQHVTNVEAVGGRIGALVLDDGARVAGRVVVDASYEGDVMAAAGVSYAVGREPRSAFGEPLAGIRFVERPEEVASFVGEVTVDEPVEVAVLDERGELLAGVQPADGMVLGAGDRKPMVYNFRVTLSEGPDRVEICAPDGYDATRFELLARYLHHRPETRLEEILAFSPFASGEYSIGPGGRTRCAAGAKWELNNRQNAVISLGHPGGQFEWPDAGQEERRRIWEDHRAHNQGLLFFLAHDGDVPAPLRRQMGRFGLAPDEFADHEHWPYQLYVREARRMVGEYVLTQHDIQRDRHKHDAIALGSHWIDGHHVQRVALSPTSFRNEGRIWAQVQDPFHIPYRAITPRAEECETLLVPVCASATKVGFCPVRLEATWMAVGHAAGAAAALAVEHDVAVQRIDRGELRARLHAAGVRL